MTVSKYEKGTGGVKKKNSTRSPKTKKVRFLKSPTTAFRLAYNAGHITNLPTKLAEEVVKAGYGEFV